MSAPDADLIRQALLFYNSGRIEQAEPLFQRLRDADPNDWQFELMIGLCRYSRADFDRAEQHLQRAAELGDGQAATHYYLGRLMLDRGQLRQARGEFAQAIALDPNHVEARTGMGHAALLDGDFARASAELKIALRASDRHPATLALLARALAEQGDKSARSYAQRAVDLAPDSALTHDALGRAFLAEGYLAFAEQSFRNALKIGPERADTLAALGRVLALQRRHAEALEQYQAANRAGLSSPQLFVAVVEALERAGNPQQARDVVAESLQRWPGDPGLARASARHAREDGSPDRALQQLESIGDQGPELELERIELLRLLGRSAEAGARVEALLHAPGDDAPERARVLAAQLRVEAAMAAEDDAGAALDQARAMLAPLLDRPGSTAATWIAWVDLCQQAGDWQRAIEALDRVLQREDVTGIERARLSCRLGNLHDRADQLAAAWSNWSRGGWRQAPHRQKLEAQLQFDLLSSWPAAGLDPWPAVEFDDLFPPVVLVGGWPGAGRELLIEALRAHPGVRALDPEGDSRRRDALGLPLGPEALARRSVEELGLGRRRFLRGVDRNSPPGLVLDPDWWEASALPALLRHFPDLTLLWPSVGLEDLAVQWRADGYEAPDRLLELCRQEHDLLQWLRTRFPDRITDISREALLGNAEATIESVFAGLGLRPEPASVTAASRTLAGRHWMPAGSGARYGLDPKGRPA
jgi:tetratricopeptide (TPR) repeat protein